MTQPELRDLADDIKANGLLAPVTLYEDKVLDGRNRYRACKLAGVEPKFRQLPKGQDPLKFVLSANVHRRHLTESQRALIAARLATMQRGRPKGDAAHDSPHTSSPLKSVAEAARELDVSPSSVERAKRVLREASPAEVHAVERGEKTVKEAAREVKEKKSAPAEHLDKTGHSISANVLPDWQHAEALARPLLADISRVKVAVERGLADGDLAFREVSNTLAAELGSAYAQLKQILPYAVCPTCQGHARANCRLCKGRGYVSEFAWKQYVPEETKRIRKGATA